MGGGTGTGGDATKYMTIALDQPWGKEEVRVRTFPPCEVKNSLNSAAAVTVFVNSIRTKSWLRQRVGNYGFFPRDGFVAWDDKNEEYAWHEVGTIDVPHAVDPKVSKFTPIIRGESEAVGADRPRRPRGDRRSRFMRWWDSLGGSEDTLDFLRKDN